MMKTSFNFSDEIIILNLECRNSKHHALRQNVALISKLTCNRRPRPLTANDSQNGSCQSLGKLPRKRPSNSALHLRVDASWRTRKHAFAGQVSKDLRRAGRMSCRFAAVRWLVDAHVKLVQRLRFSGELVGRILGWRGRGGRAAANVSCNLN